MTWYCFFCSDIFVNLKSYHWPCYDLDWTLPTVCQNSLAPNFGHTLPIRFIRGLLVRLIEMSPKPNESNHKKRESNLQDKWKCLFILLKTMYLSLLELLQDLTLILLLVVLWVFLTSYCQSLVTWSTFTRLLVQ